MTDRRAPTAPTGLQPAGKRLWRVVVKRFEFKPDELVVLAQVCGTVDVLEALAEVVAREGTVLDGGRIHPAVIESRLQRDSLGRLVRQLALPDDTADDTVAAAKFGRRGARARWNRRGGS